MEAKVRAEMEAEVRAEIEAKVRAEMEATLRAEIEATVRAESGVEVDDQVRSRMGEEQMALYLGAQDPDLLIEQNVARVAVRNLE